MNPSSGPRQVAEGWEFNKALYEDRLLRAIQYDEAGKITKSLGLIFEAHLPGASVGSICRILRGRDLHSQEGVDAEVIGFRDKRVLLMPFEDAAGVNNDSLVVIREKASTVSVGPELLGRVIDGRGNPIDGKGPIFTRADRMEEKNLYAKPSHPLEREVIRKPLDLGVRSINGLLTVGKGQRIGIMAGSGVGKSVLLGMVARHTTADVNVIALIGERGREVREFIERDLGPEGMARSVVIVATSDKSPLLRMRAAFLATSVAEYFRDKGSDVLLMMDSVTRFSMAQREIGLSQGEPPASKGYTPSVFSMLPKLLERAGTNPGKGSITGIYTVLVEGDDLDDPIADSARSILDGHIVLSRKIAQRNHFPAVDVLQSSSRVMRSVADVDHLKWAGAIREWMALYAQAEDLINIGAYVRGSNAKIDQAIAVHDRIDSFLRQGVDDPGQLNETLTLMHSIVRAAESATSTQTR
ncbi:MAG: FliI/YscN family ATPase [Bdellovibrionales bacterium]|nr:FliI/YscN family ATPase [Bdellovibrionales bacterium]